MVFPHVDHTCCHEKNIREGKFNYLITQCVYSSCFLEQQKEKKIGWQIQKCCTRQKAIPRTERLYSLIDPRLNSLAVFLSLLGLVEIHACNKWNKITYGHMITQRDGATMHLHQKKGLKVLSIPRILQLCKSRQRFLPSCMLNVDQPKGGNFKSAIPISCFLFFDSCCSFYFVFTT